MLCLVCLLHGDGPIIRHGENGKTPIKLVSHWHSNFSRLFREFSRGLCTTFVRVSQECRVNFHVSRTSHELVAEILNMFKNMRIFSPKYFARLSRDRRAVR